MRTISKSTEAYLKPYRGAGNGVDRCELEVYKTGAKAFTHFLANFWQPCDWSHNKRTGPTSSVYSWINGFPEKKQVLSQTGGLQLELPITDMVVERIATSFVNGSLLFKSPEAAACYNNVIMQGMVADSSAEVWAKFKELGEVPQHSYELNAEYPLAPYQQVALRNSMFNPNYGLTMEQGTGKTPVVIARICNEAKVLFDKEKRMYRAIIVCPRNIRANWEAEFVKFATQPGITTILRGTATKRTEQLVEAMMVPVTENCKYSIIICSYETFTRTLESIRKVYEFLLGKSEINLKDELQRIPLFKFDLAVTDESHKFKSRTTDRAKSVEILRDISAARMFLTGTPICNTPLDLYTQLEFLGQGVSGFHSFKGFKYFFASLERLQDGREIYLGMQNKPFMQERLARYTYSAKQAEVNKDLPDRVYDIVEVSMCPQQRDVYCKVRDQLMVEIQNELDRSQNRSMAINNTLTKLLRLAQITSGFINWSEQCDEEGNIVSEAAVDQFNPDNKLEAIVELLKDKGPDDKTIIWSNWVQNLKTIKARLDLEDIDAVLYYGQTSDADRAIAEYRYNCDPACRVFIGNQKCCAEGLNLLGYPPPGHEIYSHGWLNTWNQSEKRFIGTTPEDWTTNTTHEIYCSQGWSLTERDQSEKRGANRKGSRKHVRITDLVVPGTIDMEIRRRVLAKKMQALEVSDIRNILEAIVTGNLIDD